MSSDKNYGVYLAATALTAAFGDETAGWTTPGLDVSMLDFILLELTYVHQDTAATLSLQPMFGDRSASDLDDYYAELEDPNADGALTDLVKTWDVSGLTDATSYSRTLRLDVRGVSRLRVAAMVDVATDSPTLALRYLGSGRPIPEITAPIPA